MREVKQGLTTADFGNNIGFSQALVDKVVDSVMAAGIKTNADIIDYATLYQMQRAGQRVPFYVSKEAVDTAEQVLTRFDMSSNRNGLKNVKFEQQGGFLTGAYTIAITSAIQEVYDNSMSSSLEALFPAINVPASEIVTDVWAAPGGLMDAYIFGQAAKEVTKIGRRQYTWSGVPYRNYLTMNEQDITFYRNPGDPNLSARGFLNILAMYTLQAKTLMMNRVNALRSTIFSNGVDYYGAGGQLATVSYQIPTWNQVTSVTDPTNKWGNISPVTGACTVNPESNPILDFYYYLQLYPAWTAIRSRVRNATIRMNPRTEYLVVNNPNTQRQIAIIQSSPGSMNDPRGQHSAETALMALIPGVDVKVIVDYSGYLLQNSDVSWAANGSGFTSTAPQQQYFIPDGQIMFEFPVSDKGGELGNFVFTSAIQNGGAAAATPGPWMAMEDLTAPGSRGGPLNPSVQLDFGFNGGLKVTHPEAVLIGNMATYNS